jgi:DNA-binding transcriptional LysR family regulator
MTSFMVRLVVIEHNACVCYRSSAIAITSRPVELRHLSVFVAVAEEGSFTRAADRLHVVQSAVSASVRGLERELGVTLFDRTTHRDALTDPGSALLPEARATLAAAMAAREAVDQVRGGLRGTVTLGVMQAQAMAAISVPRLLRAFRDHHPAVEVRLRHGGGSAAMADQLREGRLDLGVLSLPERKPAGLTLTALSCEPIHLVCHPGHRLAQRADVELSMLADERFADLPPSWGVPLAVERALAAAGVRRTVVYEVNDTSTVIELVAEGLAVALLPRWPAFVDDAVAFVPIRHHAPSFETSIAVSSERRPSAAAAALLELAKQQAQPATA